MNSPDLPGAELTCQQLVELLSDYLEDGLPPPDRERFELHLAECLGCERYLDQMRRTLAALGGLRAAALPTDERTRLVALFEEWRAAGG